MIINNHTIQLLLCVFKYGNISILLHPFIPHSMMWNNLPSDLLANIFSYLPPPSLARAMAACRHWHDCGRTSAAGYKICGHQYPPWFIALPTRNNNLCFVHNSIENTWHLLNLDHVPSLTRPVSTIAGHGLILFKSVGGVPIRLTVCNPFTGWFHPLPLLRKPRTNPAVGVIEGGPDRFQLYVAGGMSEAASSGAASYEPTLETFDSKSNKWTVIGSMPVEFAVRLTVWTPNESVYSNGVLYWMTSARAYSIMGFEIGSNKWAELSVPMGDTLEFATLITRVGKLAVIGGVHGGYVVVWERGDDGEWVMIEKIACELGNRFMSSKCVGIEGCVCLYKEIGSGMMVWRSDEDSEDKWVWNSIEGCNRVSGKRIENCPIKGLFLHPNLTFSIGLKATTEIENKD
ncbi:putative F-box domain, kelch-type beta propeller, F-box-like domain superfamily [Helianthus annuus]|uniref:F-box domain, kelch-type beta propeller, F-box-like domain superfamily n=3 Tax=Helianthus annuus TaxID=4232 RepID=A0A9K3DP66_HELAN|nr:putative F-box domain, kelch-type beta propeller, F-box-like domain superfamily [Helianthus annuus]KAJ0639375.1 putative F-box domain, kelch-type beta propeller, F-box-like domain superfamily [Helianthus annuus]KAJ0643360.1 putative F-box domain, kelch-type beta propeller, F-box-like domain superfamily [Helianthus annuus]